MYWKMMIKRTGVACLPNSMMIKLDTLVPAKHAIYAKTKVCKIFPLPSHKKEAKTVSTLTFGKMAGLAEWAGPSLSS